MTAGTVEPNGLSNLLVSVCGFGRSGEVFVFADPSSLSTFEMCKQTWAGYKVILVKVPG